MVDRTTSIIFILQLNYLSPVQVPAAVVTTQGHLQSLDVRREEKVEEVEDRLAVVAVHTSGQTLGQEEGGRVLEQTGPHAGRELLQEERSQLAPDSGETLLGWTVIPHRIQIFIISNIWI